MVPWVSHLNILYALGVCAPLKRGCVGIRNLRERTRRHRVLPPQIPQPSAGLVPCNARASLLLARRSQAGTDVLLLRFPLHQRSKVTLYLPEQLTLVDSSFGGGKIKRDLAPPESAKPHSLTRPAKIHRKDSPNTPILRSVRHARVLMVDLFAMLHTQRVMIGTQLIGSKTSGDRFSVAPAN